jgi:hypothetical protein
MPDCDNFCVNKIKHGLSRKRFLASALWDMSLKQSKLFITDHRPDAQRSENIEKQWIEHQKTPYAPSDWHPGNCESHVRHDFQASASQWQHLRPSYPPLDLQFRVSHYDLFLKCDLDFFSCFVQRRLGVNRPLFLFWDPIQRHSEVWTSFLILRFAYCFLFHSATFGALLIAIVLHQAVQDWERDFVWYLSYHLHLLFNRVMRRWFKIMNHRKFKLSCWTDCYRRFIVQNSIMKKINNITYTLKFRSVMTIPVISQTPLFNA